MLSVYDRKGHTEYILSIYISDDMCFMLMVQMYNDTNSIYMLQLIYVGELKRPLGVTILHNM